MNQEQEQQWGGEEGAGRGATSALNHCNLQELVLARRLHNTYTHTHTHAHTHTHTHTHRNNPHARIRMAFLHHLGISLYLGLCLTLIHKT